MNTKYIGMDLHKKTSSFCVVNKEGEILLEKQIATTTSEVEKFIKSLGKQDKIKLVMEPLSQWYFYADFIEKLGVEVKLAHPTKVKAIAYSKIKTDSIDAKVLAHLLRADLIPEAYFAPKEVRELKELSRTRLSLIDLQIQVKNKIHNILFRNALIYPKTTLFTKTGLSWLQELKIPEVFRLNLETNLRNLEHLRKEIYQIEKVIKKTVDEDRDMVLLKTIPGISYVTALTIKAEIGDINRFANEKKLHSYAGLIPTIRSSGGITRYGHISKQGSSYLRFTMVQVAQVQRRLKRKSGLKWYFERMMLNKKNSKTAVVATARKLLTIVFKVLSEGRPFEDRLPNTINILSSN